MPLDYSNPRVADAHSLTPVLVFEVDGEPKVLSDQKQTLLEVGVVAPKPSDESHRLTFEYNGDPLTLQGAYRDEELADLYLELYGSDSTDHELYDPKFDGMTIGEVLEAA